VGPKGVQKAYEQIIDLPLDHIVVMGYRNYAGNPCNDNGLICLHEEQILYAHRQKREGAVLVGLRTTSLKADSGEPIETFHGMPDQYVQDEKSRVVNQFLRYSGFGGFATHRYAAD
jgi:hypothetical protein